ncbi:MAG: GTP cyclohydrolase I FolE [Bacillota bacterium]
MDKDKIKHAVRLILEAVGEDPDREGLRETPRRVADMYDEIFAGLHKDPGEPLSVVFKEEHDEMIIVKDIPVYSMCEHHLLPFFGQAHVAYIPRNGKITGLSKLARLVDLAAKRPQVQERLTVQVAELLMERLDAQGVLVVVEAEHLCMSMRGIKKPGSRTVTSAVRGVFEEHATRMEAMHLINRSGA